MSNFQKIIKLVNKTADKFIIIDKNGEPACVLMSMDEYEKIKGISKQGDQDFMANFSDFSSKNTEVKAQDIPKNNPKDLTEKEILDKINRELAEWQKSQEQQKLVDLEDDLGQNFEEEEDKYYLEPIE